MPPPNAGPPVPGSLRVLVLRATGIRPSIDGSKPDPQIRLRILTNPKTSDSARVETNKIVGTNQPEYNQEFVLKVPDAHNAQLGKF